jgi:hypothetical protein
MTTTIYCGIDPNAEKKFLVYTKVRILADQIKP